MISPRTFVEKIWERVPNATVELPEELQKSLEAAGHPELEAIVIAEKLLPRVKNLLHERILYYERKNVTPNFRFSETSPNRLIAIRIFEKDEQVRLKFPHRKELHTFINTINWEKFENLCILTLQLSGFEKYAVGKRRQDGGLDFFGLYPMQSPSVYKGLLTDMSFRIFGQAKQHRRSSVSGDEVRVFFSHYDEFLNKRGAAWEFVSSNCDWFLEAKGPFAPMVVTNRRFAKGAEEYADYRRIFLREGIQIVEDVIRLADSKIWLNAGEGGYIFAPDKFESYLDKLGGGTFSL